MDTATAKYERLIFFLMRIAMGWTFLYAASHQVFVEGWSVTGFLDSTTTFHWLFGLFTGPVLGPVVSFVVKYAHLILGITLVLGLFTRVAALGGIALMILYWMAHMDFPYISNQNNFMIDFHIVYALVLWLVILRNAGHVWGLDGWLAGQPAINRRTLLRRAIG